MCGLLNAIINVQLRIRNLVGERWLSDYEIDSVFSIINKMHKDTIGFVCKPTRIMYSFSGLREKIQSVVLTGTIVSRIIVVLNVGCYDDGTCYICDEKTNGVHWSLLAIDLINHKTYYGDSLG